MKKRILSVCLVLALCLAIGPAALAANSADDPTKVTDGNAAWGEAANETWYVVDGDVTIQDRIEVTGTVNLTLADSATLTTQQGIHVPEGSSLIIWDQSGHTGALSAHGGVDQSGIGSNSGETSGDITIHGGVIYAVGDSGHAGGAAAIGGGHNGSAGDIAITGGTIIAIGGSDGDDASGASAIGGGHNGGTGDITITGGTITAKAGDSDTPAIGATPEFDGFEHMTYGNDTSNTSTDAVVERTGQESDDWSQWHWVRIMPLGGGSAVTQEDETPTETAPKTGDGTEILPWLLLMALSSVGLVTVLRRRGRAK